MTTPNETSASPLLTLPAELRNQIYYFALTSDDPIDVPSSGEITKPGLLSTYKQVRKEAKLIFYGTNKFTLTVDDNTPYQPHPFLTKTPKEARDAIDKIIIHYHPLQASQVTQSSHSLQTLFNRMVGLRTSVLPPAQHQQALEHEKRCVGRYWKAWIRWLSWLIERSGGYEKLEHEVHSEYDRNDPCRGSTLEKVLSSIWDHEMERQRERLQDSAIVAAQVAKLDESWAEGL